MDTVHALVESATTKMRGMRKACQLIAIHAPVLDATGNDLGNDESQVIFQSTYPLGCNSAFPLKITQNNINYSKIVGNLQNNSS